MSFHTLSLAKNSHFSFLPSHFPSNPLRRGYLCGAEIRNEFTLSVAKKYLPVGSDSLKWREPRDEWSKTQNKMIGSSPVLYRSSHRKNESNQYQKLLEIEKEIVREVARGDKHYLRKSTDRKAQISPLNWTNAFLICALLSVDLFS